MTDLVGRPPRVLAELLQHRATQNAIVRSYGIMPSSRPEDDDLDRAVAVLLCQQAEQLDTLRNAIDPRMLDCWTPITTGATGDVSELGEAPCGDCPGCTLADAVDALAAAGGGVPEEGATSEQ